MNQKKILVQCDNNINKNRSLKNYSILNNKIQLKTTK